MRIKHTSHPRFIIAGIAIALLLNGCGNSKNVQNKLVIKGSETLLPLVKALSDEYNEVLTKPVEFEIAGGGSQAGIKALEDGAINICMSSKAMPDEDKQFFLGKKLKLVEIPVALDAVVIAVSKDNAVSKITIEQLQSIYSGEITNWSQLGGKDLAITPLSRAEGSGSLSLFKEKVMLEKPFGAAVKTEADAETMIKTIGATPGAIAFFGGSYKNDKVKLMEVSKDGGATFIAPEEKNLRANYYPFVIPLNVYYVLKEDSTLVKKFVDFATSKKGRYKITDLGFIPAMIED